jgi:hypothetical protein
VITHWNNLLPVRLAETRDMTGNGTENIDLCHASWYSNSVAIVTLVIVVTSITVTETLLLL